MDKKTILITGITGFLGRNMVRYIKTYNLNYNIIGLANSEKKIELFNKDFNVKVYKINLTSDSFYNKFDVILKQHKVDYVIHSAAMKHVNICEANLLETIRTNVIASAQIVDLCKINNVKNLICLSTDKANTPFNAYGMSKNLMEKYTLDNDYSVYQGANFFGSDGSVIDIWFNQMCSKIPLTITDLSCIRYFNNVEYIIEVILKNIDTKGIFLPKYVYEIKLSDLHMAFTRKFNFYEQNVVGRQSFEKIIEELNPEITDIRKLDVDGIAALLDNFFSTSKINIIKA